MTPRKPTYTKQEKDKFVRMSFDLDEDLRIKFKAKLAEEGKTAKEVLEGFIKDYTKKK